MSDFNALLAYVLRITTANSKALGIIAALAIILRLSRAQKTQLVTDLKHVGRINGEPQTSKDEFDVIIIGGGTAGCVLASRLTEDPSIRVLVLESGGSGSSLLASRIPIAFPKLMGTPHCWNDRTTPQVHMGNQVKYWPQGRMLGGSSSMNGMVFQYAGPEDYDEWSRLNSDPGAEIWAHKNFNKYFLKFERYNKSKEFPLLDATLRGLTGLVDVGHFSHYSAIGASFVKSCIALGVPQTHDFNTPSGSIGVAKPLTYINHKGQRVSAESAYLPSDVLKRPNLRVAINAQVTRILFEQSNGSKKAVGVEFSNSQNGPYFQARARKEVVVSAGALRTPQVLMLSGVGPADQLAEHSIPLVHELPGVGAHLMDHPVVDVAYRAKTKAAIYIQEASLSDRLYALFNTLRWATTGTGPFTSTVLEACAFVRSTDPTLFPNETSPTPEDSTSGPNAPDLELFVTPFAYNKTSTGSRPPGYCLSLHHVLLRPTSVGTVTLRSNNPFDKPVIDPQYLSTQHDVDVLVRGFKLIHKIAKEAPLASLIDDNDKNEFFDVSLHDLSDEELANVVKKRVETLFHPSCTARMAPLKDGGVVDPYLRVHGIPNLRVVDASVFPTIVAAHTSATVYAIAEQAADLIKAAVGRKANSYHYPWTKL